jgi:hypothetical protein
MTPHPKSPTPRQLSYLKALAARAGQSFSYPSSFAQASCEIQRLKQITTTGFTFAELQAEQVARTLHDDLLLDYSPAFRAGEISGYGASATWSSASTEGRS